MVNIVFCELICGADEHTYFNSRFVFRAIKECTHSNSKLSFLGDEGHFNRIFKNLHELGIENDSIEFRKLVLPNRGYSEKRRIIYDFVNLLTCLFFSLQKGKDTRVFVLTTSPNILFFFSLFQRIVSFKLSFIFHSILTDLVLHHSNRRLDLFFGINHALLFAKKSKYDFIVLGDNIKKQLSSIIPDLNVRTIFHPMSPLKDKRFDKLNFPIIIGFVGQGTLHKGFDLFLELIDALKNENCFRFKMIGRVSNEFKNDKRLKTLELSDNFLSDQDYSAELTNLNYMLMLHAPDKYRLTASGTFVDALEHKIPIIGITNTFIDEYFTQFGLMGYVVNDIESITIKLNEISRSPVEIIESDYNLFRRNMYKAHRFISDDKSIYID